MNIVFYNTFGIGDLFFNKPFLKHLCESNPTIQFQINTNYASFFFKDIPNLKQVDQEDLPIHHPKRYKIYQYFNNHAYDDIVQPNPDTLLVNTWVTVLNPLIEPLNCECNPVNLYLAFQKLVEKINTYLVSPLVFPPLEKKDFLYKMPSFPLENFYKYKQQEGKEMIYYFNRMGQSASSKPFSREEDHKAILNDLSTLYPNKIILVPNIQNIIDRPNIIPTRYFGSSEDNTCENVLFDMELALHCNYAIVFDIGSCLTYCNDRFGTYPAKIYHMSKGPCYSILLKEGIQECLEVDTSKVEYVSCSTPDEVVSEIQKRIV